MITQTASSRAANASKSPLKWPLVIAAIGCLFFAATSPARAQGSLAPVTVGGMSFAKDWIPQIYMKSKLQANLAFYAHKAVGRSEPHHEPVPTALRGRLTWLMPATEAFNTLPVDCDHAPEMIVTYDCFPKNSLTIAGFHPTKTHFVDRGQTFDWMYMVLDRQRRLVGVELMAISPRTLAPWVIGDPPAGGLVGKMGPYYDFINMRNNASTTQRVEYGIAPAGKGVTLIHTALFRGEVCLNNVHWYMAAPFARALLDIASYQHRAGR